MIYIKNKTSSTRKENDMIRAWNEADHPRDEQGKFTDKGGGGSSYSPNGDSETNKMQRRADSREGLPRL